MKNAFVRPGRAVLVVAVLFAAAAGIAYATVPDNAGVFNACMLKATGTIRLVDPSAPAGSLLSRPCNASIEAPVSFNQRGQPGPPGNTDSTVRHISQFMFDGHTVTTPIVSARGERGKLSISCSSDPDGSHRGVGQITFTTANTSSTLDALTFTSPSIPGSSLAQQVHGQASFPWSDPPNDNVSFEMLLESQIEAPQPPTLTDIRGFIQHFDFGGCAFYVFADTSEVASPMTFTP